MRYLLVFLITCFSILLTGCVNNILPSPSNTATAPNGQPPGGQNPAPNNGQGSSAAGGQGSSANNQVPAEQKPTTVSEIQTQGTIGNQPVTIEITQLKRIAGDMVMLRLAVTNNGSDKINNVELYARNTDTYLIDAEKQKKYPVVRDANYNALASDMSSTGLAAGQRADLFAQFPAPPPTTGKMTVYFGGATPILDVPVMP